MSDKPRIPLAEAEAVAAELVELLRPAVERIEIAGSIRRRRPDVGDLEICCVPRFAMVAADLFGEGRPVDQLHALCSELISQGELGFRLDRNGHMAFGERYKRLSFRGYPLDIFCVLHPAQWGVIFAIRTGPADFSHRMVKDRRYGGMLPEWAEVRDGAVRHRRSGEVLQMPEESDLFRVLGYETVPPPEARA